MAVQVRAPVMYIEPHNINMYIYFEVYKTAQRPVELFIIDHITCAQSIENGVDYEESFNSPDRMNYEIVAISSIHNVTKAQWKTTEQQRHQFNFPFNRVDYFK